MTMQLRTADGIEYDGKTPLYSAMYGHGSESGVICNITKITPTRLDKVPLGEAITYVRQFFAERKNAAKYIAEMLDDEIAALQSLRDRYKRESQ